MPATMTRKRHKPGPPPLPEPTPEIPPRGRSGKPVQVYLSDELAGALDDYIGLTRPKPTKTSVIEMALEDLLKKAGCFPRKKGDN